MNLFNKSSAENETSGNTVYDVPLRTRKALKPKNLYRDSTVLVLNWTALNSINAFQMTKLHAYHYSSWSMSDTWVQSICRESSFESVYLIKFISIAEQKYA